MVSTSKTEFPNLIIAGAPKCGTSSLFFWLGAHPSVCASKVKETYFLADEVIRFNENLNVHKHGLDAYTRFFKHCNGERYRLEATPTYIYGKTPLTLIPKLPEVPKVIFVLRNPSDRLYSHWRFNRYRMKNTELSFEEYLDIRNLPSNWQNYLNHTNYVDYLKPWVNALGHKNILVYQFEKMVQNHRDFMKELSDDLQIDSSFYQDYGFFHRNQTVAIGNKWLHGMGLRLEPLVPQWVQEKVIPLYLRVNSRRAPKISLEDIALKRGISEDYRGKNLELAKLFPSIDLSLW